MDDVVVTIKEPKKKIEESQKEQLVRQLELGDWIMLDWIVVAATRAS